MGAGCSADYLFLPPARARVQAPICACAPGEDAQGDELGASAQRRAFQGLPRGGGGGRRQNAGDKHAYATGGQIKTL